MASVHDQTVIWTKYYENNKCQISDINMKPSV